MTDPIYLRITNSIKQDILEGRLKPGDDVPTIREQSELWGCTQGTIQRAYRELAQEGLIVSRSGLGTRVASKPAGKLDTPVRKTALIHKAESFILESINSGYTTEETHWAFEHALDRFRVEEPLPIISSGSRLSFYGSHDLAMARIVSRFEVLNPSYLISLVFNGSLGGLIALEEGKADFAGCHLWDSETATYNIPFIRKLLPGRSITLVTLAERSLGLIIPSNNPLGIKNLQDIANPQVKFVNRQSGSGTRVWLDDQFKDLHIDPKKIKGYETERSTHSEIAQVIAEGGANAGIGLEASAQSLGLGFIPLTLECYQLAVPTDKLKKDGVKIFFHWLESVEVKRIISSIPGYLTFKTGERVEIS
jgi:molybdate-binding protein/DNA-binding transcriptional regulator YhcF (GntR family)